MTISESTSSETKPADKSTGLQFGLQMVVGSRDYAQVAAIAEEVGFTSLHISDHLVYPSHVPTNYPYTDDGVLRINGVEFFAERVPCYDPFVQMGYLAAATQSMLLITNVCVAPLYHPLALARSLATVDRLSAGRVVLGLGVGWLAEEFAAVGAGFKNRGRRTDSIITILRRLWTEETIDYKDEFYEFGPIQFNPKPLGRGAIPIHIGGSSQAALRRAGRFGDGWIEIGSGGIDNFAEMLSVVKRERRDAGRSDLPFEITTTANPDDTLDDYRRLADLGVSRTVVIPNFGDGQLRGPESFRDWAQRFRDDVIGKV